MVVGAKGQNSTFLEYGNVAYHIKRNDKIFMQQHGGKYFVCIPPKVNIQYFQNMVLLHNLSN